MLVAMCGSNHGYDLLAWHKEMCSTKAGGYRWGKCKGIPKIIENVLSDPNWIGVVAEIEKVDAERMKKCKAKADARS